MDKVIENCGGVDSITYNIEDNYYGFSLWLNNGDIVIYGTPDRNSFKDNMKTMGDVYLITFLGCLVIFAVTVIINNEDIIR